MSLSENFGFAAANRICSVTLKDSKYIMRGTANAIASPWPKGGSRMDLGPRNTASQVREK